MGGFLEYLSLNWDHVVELAIGHAIVVAISLALQKLNEKVDVKGQLEDQVAEEWLKENGFI
jgi:hypothetical protein